MNHRLSNSFKIYISTLTVSTRSIGVENNEDRGCHKFLKIDAVDILQRATFIQHLSHMSFLLRCEVQFFLTSVFSIFVYLILFEKGGFQISMSRDFSEKIRNFSLGKTGLFQKIGNFTETHYTYDSQF